MPSDAQPTAASTSVRVQTAALNAWRAGVIVDLARTEVCDSAPIGQQVSGERISAHVERVDAILAGAAALLRELHAELMATDDRLVGRE